MLFQQLVGVAFIGQAIAKAVDLHRLYTREEFGVNRYAALGDSFAAGPGAGKAYDESWCHRSEGAWPRLVAADTKIRKDKDTIDKFEFNACTGALSKHVYRESQKEEHGPNSAYPQTDRIVGLDPQLVTLSIGGNDVGFVELLDQCVYRFSHPGCVGCGQNNEGDCTEECESAMNTLRDKIDGVNGNFPGDFNGAIEKIFKEAPKTHLFITGYPRFWNDTTDYCDTVSFKLLCVKNNILPLIKDRRKKMNDLTLRLNDKIKSMISAITPPQGSTITYVDTDPYFEGHRFCEEGVKEPSYRNRNIWFFPLEFYTDETMTFTVTDKTPVGDCGAMLDEGRGAGAYYACLMANDVLNGTVVELHSMSNNVATAEGEKEPSPNEFWWFAVRTFHPTMQGHEAYHKAFFAEFDKLQGGGAEADPLVKCNELNDHYITRDTLSTIIANEYCPKLAGMTSTIGTGYYLSGTPEAVEISAIDWDADGVPTPDECYKHFQKIISDCNNDDANNPMGWKAGGEVEFDNWTYKITPSEQRPPAPSKPSGWCSIEQCTEENGCVAKLWGAGWLNSGYGHELREAFDKQQANLTQPDVVDRLNGHKGIDTSLWGENFKYEAKDGHEWTVEFQCDTSTEWLLERIITDNMRAAAGNVDLVFPDGGNCKYGASVGN